LISPSQFLRDKCLELGFKHPIQVLCNPIDFEVEPNVNFEQRQDAVLFAASLDDSKGVHTVIELAKRNPDIIFYFAGKGPLEKMIISESIKYSNIKYLGYLCRDDIKKSMRNVKCFIIASIWHEVLGMVVLEAFSQNCAVIGAKSGGITELLEGGRGILFRPNDPLSANEALQKCFLLNKNEYIKMAEKANAALNGASLAGYCKRIENLFLHWKLTTRQKNG
jgi:glycosyltransferase involved in cell wall biosynthesis